MCAIFNKTFGLYKKNDLEHDLRTFVCCGDMPRTGANLINDVLLLNLASGKTIPADPTVHVIKRTKEVVRYQPFSLRVYRNSPKACPCTRG